MIGQILGGNYQIQAQLGKGGFGITFTAIDLRRPGNPQCIVKQSNQKISRLTTIWVDGGFDGEPFMQQGCFIRADQDFVKSISQKF